MLRLTLSVALAALCLQGCDKNGPIQFVPESTEEFGFESSLEGWEVKAGNLEAPGALHVVRQSNVAPSTGSGSAEFRIDNFNSNARAWLQRVVTLTPDVEYSVTFELDLGSSDAGGTTPWHVVAAALPGTEVGASSMSDQGSAHVNAAASGVVFARRTFTLRVKSHAETGEVVLGLGIWGRTTGERVYYMDNVKIEFLRGSAVDGTPPGTNPVN